MLVSHSVVQPQTICIATYTNTHSSSLYCTPTIEASTKLYEKKCNQKKLFSDKVGSELSYQTAKKQHYFVIFININFCKCIFIFFGHFLYKAYYTKYSTHEINMNNSLILKLILWNKQKKIVLMLVKQSTRLWVNYFVFHNFRTIKS